MAGPEPSVTSLSGPKLSRPKRFAGLACLVRRSLGFGLLVVGGQGCLITASPDFAAVHQTRPYLTSLYPPTYQVQSLTSGIGTPGTFPSTVIEFDVKSEDLGVPLLGVALLDFPGPTVGSYTRPPIDVIDRGQIPPGHLEDPDRHVRREFTLQATPGCHSITLILTHEFKSLYSNVPKEPSDVAEATWWYDVDDDPLVSGSTELQKCVTGRSKPDAGPVDAGGQ